MRRRHNKSRAGCKECKRRHVKCDERHPSCANCSLSQRLCSFLLLAVDSRPLAQATNDAPDCDSPAAPVTRSSTATPIVATAVGPTTLPRDYSVPLYALSHIELVLHFEKKFVRDASMGSDFGVTFFKIALNQAFRASYLMDQIMALSSAHKSTTALTEPSQRDSYRSEAVRLQTRALASFHGVHANSLTNNCLPIFLFSSLLGQQTIFEALSYRGDLSTTLDRLVQCLNLYCGTRAIADHSWPLIQAQFEAESGEPYPIKTQRQSSEKPKPYGQFKSLLELIGRSELGLTTTKACHDVIASLQLKYDDQQSFADEPFQRAQAVHEWAVYVPSEYIEILRQRRPEALVILATFGVLLHNARDYWSFGDAGSHLIRAITSYLGDYWSTWLEWPNQILSSSTI